MYIIYSIVVLIALFFVIRALVHSRRTHLIASKMEKKFEHYYDENAYHNDQHNERI